MRHTLVARVTDSPGVLHRVISMFRRRAFNVHSLAVGGSETPGVSRMTLVVDTDRVPTRIIEANLRKLVPVLDVQDVTGAAAVERELALIRVHCPAADRPEIADLIAIFRARIVDVAIDSVVVELTGAIDKIDGLVELLRPRGILEMVRTGKIAMVRGAAMPRRQDVRCSEEDEAAIG